MSRPSTDSILHSLKGRIWLAVSALAIVNCVAGLTVYLTVSFFSSDPFFTIFITFFALAFTTMVFGWWLSNEVNRPIETVTLLAKSLERSPSATLPRTTGSSETDELLRSLHRNSRQLQNLIGLMDDFASGKISAASIPIEQADRLSASFQKLIAKFTDSVNAKQQLDQLLGAINKIKADAAKLRNGRLDATVRSEEVQVKEMADTIRFLATRLADTVNRIRSSSTSVDVSAAAARTAIQAALDAKDELNAKISRGTALMPDGLSSTNDPLAELESTLSAIESSTILDIGTGVISSNVSEKVSRLIARISDTSKKVQKLRDRAIAFPQISRSARELARRANLVALNANISNSNGSTDRSDHFTILSGEISSLSERSELLHKEITVANETLTGEIAELEKAFSEFSNDIPEILASIAQNAEMTSEVERFLVRLSDIRPKVSTFAAKQAADAELFSKLLDLAATDGSVLAIYRETDQFLRDVTGLTIELRESVADLKSESSLGREFRPQLSAADRSEPTLSEAGRDPDPLGIIIEN